MSGLRDLVVALPQGTLARPQAFHHLIYNAFLGAQQDRAFLFKGIALAEELAIVRSRSFTGTHADLARPIVYDPTVNDYDFHLTASPQYRDTASGKLKLFPAEDDNAQRLSWLARKAETCGFAPIGDIACARQLKRVPQKGKLVIDHCEFSGRLTVQNHALFEQALERGIGPRGAYGYGLLTLYPISDTE